MRNKQHKKSPTTRRFSTRSRLLTRDHTESVRFLCIAARCSHDRRRHTICFMLARMYTRYSKPYASRLFVCVCVCGVPATLLARRQTPVIPVNPRARERGGRECAPKRIDCGCGVCRGFSLVGLKIINKTQREPRAKRMPGWSSARVTRRSVGLCCWVCGWGARVQTRRVLLRI